MGDIFDQIASAPTQGDIFDQVGGRSVQSPISPPSYPSLKPPEMQTTMGGLSTLGFTKEGGQVDPKLSSLSATGSSEGAYSDPEKGALTTGAGVVAGSTMIPGVRSLAVNAAKAAPYLAASEGINYLRQKAGKMGKFIPPGAEMIPFFMMGGKPGKPAAAVESAEAEAASVPRGTQSVNRPTQPAFPGPKEYEVTGGKDPFTHTKAPPKWEMPQDYSGNVQQYGYHPDSNTLSVQYKRGGAVYQFKATPQQYAELQKSPSAGEYIRKVIEPSQTGGVGRYVGAAKQKGYMRQALGGQQ